VRFDCQVARDETGVADVWLRKTTTQPTLEAAKVNPEVDPSKPTDPDWDSGAPEDVAPSD